MNALSQHLDKLVQWLEHIGLQPPSRQIRIVEVSGNDAYRKEDRLRLIEPPAYENRFDELLAAGYDWLNMECWGIHDDFLIVAIRPPSPTVPTGKKGVWKTRVLHPGCITSVNFSGPARMVTEMEWDVAPWLAACDVSLTTG